MDRIKITDLSFYAYHGVFEEEKKKGQMFSIDCEFTLDTSVFDDDINNTVHYGDLSVKIVEFSTNNRFDLLESLANRLSTYILNEYPLIESVSVTVHKPDAPIPTKFSDVTLSVTRKRTVCYLGIGSNLLDTKANLDAVIEEIESDSSTELIEKSDYISTKPYGVLDQPDFLNGVLKIKTIYTPSQLLKFCKLVEKKLGRINTRRWGERIIDIDILFFGSDIIFTKDLKIPHPEIELREFVLKPLAQIEPYFIHPILNKNIKTLLENLNESER